MICRPFILFFRVMPEAVFLIDFIYRSPRQIWTADLYIISVAL